MSLSPLIHYLINVPYSTGFPGRSSVKESTCNVRDLGSIPGLGRFPKEGKGYPLQCSGLEDFMDCIVHGVAKSWTQLSDFTFTTISILFIYTLLNTYIVLDFVCVYKGAISSVLIIMLLYGHILSFFLGKYLGVGMLGGMISTYFTL